jgi:hypothetical protein
MLMRSSCDPLQYGNLDEGKQESLAGEDGHHGFVFIIRLGQLWIGRRVCGSVFLEHVLSFPQMSKRVLQAGNF